VLGNGVSAGVNSIQLPTLHPPSDHPVGDARGKQLSPAHHAVLALG
jgi:hypothetical protein